MHVQPVWMHVAMPFHESMCSAESNQENAFVFTVLSEWGAERMVCTHAIPDPSRVSVGRCGCDAMTASECIWRLEENPVAVCSCSHRASCLRRFQLGHWYSLSTIEQHTAEPNLGLCSSLSSSSPFLVAGSPVSLPARRVLC